MDLKAKFPSKHHWLMAMMVCFFFFLVSVDALAADAELSEPSMEQIKGDDLNSSSQGKHGLLYAIKGRPAKNSTYLGMWSCHFLNNNDEDYQTHHDLIAAVYRGIFAGTFENSFGDRVWAIGLQRDVYSTTAGSFDWDIGYRIGLMYGYENFQLFDTNIFPLFQLYSDVSFKRFGIEVAWAGTALTFGFLVRL